MLLTHSRGCAELDPDAGALYRQSWGGHKDRDFAGVAQAEEEVAGCAEYSPLSGALRPSPPPALLWDHCPPIPDKRVLSVAGIVGGREAVFG